MKKLLVVLAAVFCPISYTYAGGPANYDVVAVGCMPQGTCYIQIAQPAEHTSCTLKNQIRFDITLPGSQAQYSAALSALMAGKQINANLTDTCIDNFPVPDWLQVNK
ncbi:MAG: hypothetical protein ACI8WB_004970 [Phenylobacterium sp.]|jgi:hypothetical protein